ncbi:MAG: flippase-like domain-containing protein [Lutibacter sp.]|nr:flippase-like domain-containing protein [Lutibacter sp.]
MVVGAFYFLYVKIANNERLPFHAFLEQLSIVGSKGILAILILLLFTDANWLLEIFKWKKLASIENKISFFEAYEQCFASLTASIITPNRIGEYGAKSIYFEKGKRKKITLLNLLGNLSQLTITVLFGVFGLLFLVRTYSFQYPEINMLKTLFFIALIVIAIVFSYKLKLKKVKDYLKNISNKLYVETLALSLLRYLFFSHQFIFLLSLFSVEIEYFTALNLLFCMYFLASIIPSIAIFDWAIKGSVAVWLFSFVGVNELTIITITAIMWMLNFAIPAIIGSIFVLNFKLEKSE